MRQPIRVAYSAMLLVACGSPLPPATASSSGSSAQPPVIVEHAHDHTSPPQADESSKDTPQVQAVESHPSTPVTAAPPTPTEADASTAANGSNVTLVVSVTSTVQAAARNAVIYLEGAPKGSEIPGTLDNRQMAFSPHVLVVTAGSSVKFTNSDPFPHNVFSPDHEKWDMGVIPAHGAKSRKFETAGVYTALCNMHPNMKAYIVVTPSSYFARVDKAGTATIRDIPPGKYKMVVWAPATKQAEQDIALDGNRSLAVELHR